MHKILVVEDDLYIRELYEEVLKGAGYDVTTAIDGQEGLFKYQNGTFNLVLLDMMMPKLDGIGFLSKLQETPTKRGDGKIILLTNMAHDPVIKQALSKGADDFLIKSDLTPATLLKKIKEFLSP